MVLWSVYSAEFLMFHVFIILVGSLGNFQKSPQCTKNRALIFHFFECSLAYIKMYLGDSRDNF